ncbi:Holliday junction branch migration protein RuvA [Anaerotignum lactatifermentans]|uniref:Holliday junction branch migration complex subunit RuvA n=1 Tax=Anaerotignum lactatifermentans TaxID=160404 RepID=A0ABS2GB63_9FIRM|nr:Holliday junction branch migration protein RuvA [Anaerotignum lactatifermentans]MBM6830146.1 Holliday junction branch migration protein RuvA [Anaerotignum lactatifermentans]MBM6878709.1 Holliday junction branch migration protein RuvA [Anaerotignum lactatifermentans]MBM6951759.1 Holliday junction branch migration protein RuvA [Anaerotignum lactatifermentans]
MIAYIKGTLEAKGNGFVIVESGGIGYRIFMSPTALTQMPASGETVKVYTYMNVKEDGISLYGFSSLEEQELFLRLITVSGVGPKGALAFLSQLRPQEIILAILSDDVKTLSKAPGVGRKTAQRVILELKDKFQTAEAVAWEIEEQAAPTSAGAKFEAIDALTALGYSRSEAAGAVNAVAAEEMTTEEILKAALKKMVRF